MRSKAEVSRSSASRTCSKARRTWMWVSSAETGVGDPLAGDQVLDDQHRHPAGGEVGGVVDPYRVGLVRRPVRDGAWNLTTGAGASSAGHGRSALSGPWRPRPTSSSPVGAAVSQAPVGEVLVGEGLEGLHDLPQVSLGISAPG